MNFRREDAKTRKVGRETPIAFLCVFAPSRQNFIYAVSARKNAGGFSYLVLLFLVAIMGVSLAASGVVWSVAQQREREKELLFIGTQFREAIAAYYDGSPGMKRYPVQLTDLLRDPRSPAMKRYLRRLYLDPMTGKADWGVVRTIDGGILGVHSMSIDKPIRTYFEDEAEKDFSGKTRYSDWVFAYRPVLTYPDASMQAGTQGGGAP